MATDQITTATSSELNRPLRTEAEATQQRPVTFTGQEVEELFDLASELEGVIAEFEDFVGLLYHIAASMKGSDPHSQVFSSLGYTAKTLHQCLDSHCSDIYVNLKRARARGKGGAS
jgi:hypothetical protein